MKKPGLKTLILVPTSVCLFILIAAFLYGIWNFQEYLLRKEFAERVDDSRRLMDIHEDADIKSLSLAIDGLVHDDTLLSLWQKRDREALNKYAQPLYKALREKFEITHFYFHDPDGTCFLRLHQPDRFGDLIKRNSMVQAHKTGGTVAGVELGKHGTLTLRVIEPITIDGRVEGYLELGEEMTHFTHEIANVLGVRLAVLLDKSFLDREGYLNGTGMHEKASNWDDLPHEIIADSQPAGISPKLLVGIVAKHGGAVHEAEKFTIKDTPYLAGAVRLSDMNNREVGRMILFENIAEQSTAIRHLMFKLGSTSLLAAIAGLLGAFVYLQRVDRILEDYNRQVLDVVRQREADQIRHVKELLPFRKAFEGAPDAMGIIDLDRRMLFVNPAFEKLTGYTQETINERGGTETLYYDPQSGSRAFLKVSQGRSFNGELKIIDQAGDSIDVYLRASPIMKDDGEMIGILGIFSDLRERKSAEQELLRQAKALVETNRALMEARNAGYAACNRELS